MDARDDALGQARAVVLNLLAALGDEAAGPGPEWITVAQLVEEIDRCTDPAATEDLLRALSAFVTNRPPAKGSFFNTDPEARRAYVLDKVGINNSPAPTLSTATRRAPIHPTRDPARVTVVALRILGCMTTVLAPERSADELHAALTVRHREVWAADAALLADIGEHDRVEAWRRMGTRSEEDYLVRYHQLGWPTAKDWVHEARVLARHPELAASYTDGTMSSDKLNAACRLAAARDAEADKALGPFDDPTSPTDPPRPPDPDPPGPADPADAPSPSDDSPAEGSGGASSTAGSAAELLALIEQMSTAQLTHTARQAQHASAAQADALYRRRHLEAVRNEDQRRLSILGAELFDDDAATVWAALNDHAATAKPDPETGLYPPLKQRYADALVAMANAYLAAHEKVIHHPLVLFHTDARILTGDDGWAETTDYSPLAAETIRRLRRAPAGSPSSPTTPKATPSTSARTVRDATWKQIEACLRRDGGCRLCGSHLFLHAHHIQWWDRDKGRTDLRNLTMVCSACHHLLHEGGLDHHRPPQQPAHLHQPHRTRHPQPPPPATPTRATPDQSPDAAGRPQPRTTRPDPAPHRCPVPPHRCPVPPHRCPAPPPRRPTMTCPRPTAPSRHPSPT